MRIDRLDHLVPTVADVDTTVAFYADVLGMDEITFADGRRALTFGTTKLNLHQAGHKLEPKAARLDHQRLSARPRPEPHRAQHVRRGAMTDELLDQDRADAADIGGAARHIA